MQHLVCDNSTTKSERSEWMLTVAVVGVSHAFSNGSGGFVKRDGRPRDSEVLTSRLIDRPLRPMFEKGWAKDTQVLAWVLSYDGVNSTEPLAITAAAVALALSEAPLKKPVAAVRVGFLPEVGMVLNPSIQQMENSQLDLVIAGTEDAVLMIEGYADFFTEEQLLEAISIGQDAISTMCRDIDQWVSSVGKAKKKDIQQPKHEELESFVEHNFAAKIRSALISPGKLERQEAIAATKEAVLQSVEEHFGSKYDSNVVSMMFKRMQSQVMRKCVLEEGLRSDGRGIKDVRSISARAGMLPRTHGSALFTRGETQAIAVATLGCEKSAQRVDSITSEENESRRFYLQYFFPPSSVGETGRVGGPGRRELGHGMLAERSLLPIIPGEDVFPYTIRVESTITESNGSSSMASVCGGCLALMDAGVPVKDMVAGVAMGLILEPNGEFVVLTDILGSEDALGDMDFKVAGNEEGVTAFQMDIKVEGITADIMKVALQQAKEGRLHILKEMKRCLEQPRVNLSQYAPRIEVISIPKNKSMELIGPAGRTIKSITEKCGCDSIMVMDGGNKVQINGPDESSVASAIEMIQGIVAEPEIGKIYRRCPVKTVTPFGCFVTIFPGKDALCHISELALDRVGSVEEVVSEGDFLDVMLMEVREKDKKMSVSRKAVLLLESDSVEEKLSEDVAASS